MYLSLNSYIAPPHPCITLQKAFTTLRKKTKTMSKQTIADTSKGWTPERRARQAELIRSWRPWERSTGAQTPEGKAKVSRNAWRGNHKKRIRTEQRMVNEVIRSLLAETRKV
jgi:hypothetical protein